MCATKGSSLLKLMDPPMNMFSASAFLCCIMAACFCLHAKARSNRVCLTQWSGNSHEKLKLQTAKLATRSEEFPHTVVVSATVSLIQLVVHSLASRGLAGLFSRSEREKYSRIPRASIRKGGLLQRIRLRLRPQTIAVLFF